MEYAEYRDDSTVTTRTEISAVASQILFLWVSSHVVKKPYYYSINWMDLYTPRSVISRGG